LDAIKRALGRAQGCKTTADHPRQGAAYAQADDASQLVETSGVPFLPMSMSKGCCPTPIRNAPVLRARPC